MKNVTGNDPQGTSKIDQSPTEGLEGVEDSLSYRVNEIEKHLHNREKWFGAAAVPNAEIHVADRMAGGISPFQLVAGADDFGAWVQILGNEDTPVSTGMVKFDAHRFLVTTTNSTNPFIIQVVAGESADIAAKIAAEEYSEAGYISSSNNNDSGIEEIMISRIPAEQKAWARCANIGSSGSLFNFYFGIHEYIG